MFFTNVARLCAWLLLIAGAIRLWIAGYLAYVEASDKPAPSFAEYLSFQTPQEAVYLSIVAIMMALLLGVLSEISQYGLRR